MALAPRLSICTHNNCKELLLTDITGSYSATNTGGWGAPNITLASVDEAIISLILPNTETAVELDVTATIVAASIVDGEFTLDDITTDDADSSETKFPDGIYNITYTITESSVDYTYTCKKLITCQVECCIEKQRVNFHKKCDTCDWDKTWKQYQLSLMLLDSVRYNFGNGNDDEAEDALEALQKICHLLSCQC
jgi:hypothetical protein